MNREVLDKLSQHRETILVLAETYLPGFKAGGPVRSVANIVRLLELDYNVIVVTRDRDLGGLFPYDRIKANSWSVLGKSKVYYIRSGIFSYIALLWILKSTHYDLMYVSSFFSRFSIIASLARWSYVITRVPVVLSPRGEFAPPAMERRFFLKSMFIYLARFFNVYRRNTWHATSEFEAECINRMGFCKNGEVQIVPNLAECGLNLNVKTHRATVSGYLRIVFLSRIAPVKNLKFLLNVLTGMSERLSLDIYGPKENLKYWQKCHEIIAKCPPNVVINVHDEVNPAAVPEVLARYDLFAFPTFGENFGHVIAESLAVGTPVMLSHNTPWQANGTNAITLVDLENGKWRDEICQWARMSREQLLKSRDNALEYMKTYLARDQSKPMTVRMFKNALCERGYQN
jgi:glycosyltransferase involved in cell wall biosynthesis